MAHCVLLIEHDPAVQAQVGHALHEAGFIVMSLADAEEALDLLGLFLFDLVLADVGTLRYAGHAGSGLTTLMRAIRAAPLLRFTTPHTMGPAGAQGAFLINQIPHDLPRLLDAVQALLRQPVAV